MRRTALVLLLVGLLPWWAACGDGDDDGDAFDPSGTPEDGGTPSDDGGDDGDGGDGVDPSNWIQFDGAWITSWTAQDVNAIERGVRNTIPIILPPEEPLSAEYYIWDWWPLRTRAGEVAVIDGWTVMIALTADRSQYLPGERHGVAAWRYWATRGDGVWQPGGLVFPEGTALGGRQWAGSALYDADTGRATFYYTALGDLPPDQEAADGAADGYEDSRNAGESITRQEIVEVSADVATGEDGVTFESFSEHDIILIADGDLYATAEQSAAGGLGPYVFRDPWYFRDPADGRDYLLFTAAAAFNPSPHAGVAGLATRDSPDGDWYLLPPVLGAFEVNSQIERPHMVVQDGVYYLFFTSHSFTFADDLVGPEGVFGFASEEAFRGRYVPLNGSGLVLANPQYEPYQTYSYLVLPGGWVTAYINYRDLGDVGLAGIIQQPPEWQREKFGGTPTPLMRIAIDGTETFLVDTLTATGLEGPGDSGTQSLAAALGEVYPHPE